MKTKRVVLVLPVTTYRAHDFSEAARHLNVEIVVATNRRQALSKWIPWTSIPISFRNYGQAVKKIREFDKTYPIDAVIGVEEESVEIATLACQALGLPCNPLEGVQAARYKDQMRQKLSEGNLLTPWFKVYPARLNPVMITNEIPYPGVIKPTFLSGSRGVQRVNNSREFIAAFRQITTLLSQPEVRRKAPTQYRKILVEEYIPGTEVAVEGMLVDGSFKLLAIFDKPDPLEGPYFTETIYVTPSRLPSEIQSQITETVAVMAAALGLQDGPIHAELRLNQQGIWPIEIAARSIGGLCARMLRFTDGISLEQLILMQALGMDISGIERESGAAGVMMMPVPRKGILKSVKGVEAARKVTGVEDVVISIAREQKVAPPPAESRYLGFIFARGEQPEEVEAALRLAFQQLEINIQNRIFMKKELSRI